MLKFRKTVALCLVVAAVIWLWGIVGDFQSLRENVIRLHVVANSDSKSDQALKLQVRDAVLQALEGSMTACKDAASARTVLEAQLPLIQQTAQETIHAAGRSDPVHVTLEWEEFDTRVYDTFTLPSGVYDSLRIVIGDGQGHNWWCVVFPRLCVPTAADEFEDTAAGAGFSDTLTGTVSNNKGYEIRFFLLDCLGKLQNLFHKG